MSVATGETTTCECYSRFSNPMEGAKIHFSSKAVLVSTFFNISLQTVKTNGDANFAIYSQSANMTVNSPTAILVPTAKDEKMEHYFGN